MEGTKKRGLSPAQKKKVRRSLLPLFQESSSSFSSFFLSFFFRSRVSSLLPPKNSKQKLSKAKEAILANER